MWVLLFILCIHTYAYLQPHNLQRISSLIQNPNLQKDQRHVLNKLLYVNFQDWAARKAMDFKYKHYHKCKRIPLDELILYSKKGLYKSILNYNGSSNFLTYSNFYVDGEIKLALTHSYSLSKLPKRVRSKSKKNMNETELYHYKQLLNTEVHSEINHWTATKISILDHYESLEKYRDAWDLINSQEPFIKRVMYLKYDYDFKVLRSNKRVALLMCCSQEYVRKKLIEFKHLCEIGPEENTNKTF